MKGAEKDSERKTKDPLQILGEVHKLNLYYFTLLLETIQRDKCMSQKGIDALTDFTIHVPYIMYTTSLIDAFTKAVQFGVRFDIDQLRQNHGVWNGIPEHQT